VSVQIHLSLWIGFEGGRRDGERRNTYEPDLKSTIIL